MSAKLLDYDVLAIIGTGTFGTCFRVRSRITGKLFVWKAIDYGRLPPDSHSLTQLVREINVLKQLAHPNIVRYFNHIAPADTHMLYIIMECCEGGDLAALIARAVRQRRRFEEPFVWRCAVQLCRAVQGCHSFNSQLTIYHRDIKPANVFLDAVGNVKLGDFGLARILRTDAGGFAETQVGTPFYQSPEVAAGSRYTGKSDIWSLGCLVYELCALRPPFEGEHVGKLRRNIMGGRFARIPAVFSVDLQRMIALMLSVDETQRPSVEMMLHHPTVVARQAGDEVTFPRLVENEEVRRSEADVVFTPQPEMSSTRLEMAEDGTFAADTTGDLRRQLFYSTIGDDEDAGDDGTRSEPGRGTCKPDGAENVRKTASEGRIRAVDQSPLSDPNEITQEVFSEAFRQRLLSIRQREAELRQQETEVRRREQAVRQREQRLRKGGRPASSSSATSGTSANRPPPLAYDASCLSIEPNETVLAPTVAKLDANVIRRPKAFVTKASSSSRPVSSIIINHASPTHMPVPPPLPARNRPASMAYSQHDLAEAVTTALLTEASRPKASLFQRFQRNFKAPKKPPVEVKAQADIPVVSSDEIPAKWTDETKRTAFAMLAAMNANNHRRPLRDVRQQDGGDGACADRTIVDEVLVGDRLVRHDRKRQSMAVVASTAFAARPGSENRPVLSTML